MPPSGKISAGAHAYITACENVRITQPLGVANGVLCNFTAGTPVNDQYVGDSPKSRDFGSVGAFVSVMETVFRCHQIQLLPAINAKRPQ